VELKLASCTVALCTAGLFESNQSGIETLIPASSRSSSEKFESNQSGIETLTAECRGGAIHGLNRTKVELKLFLLGNLLHAELV